MFHGSGTQATPSSKAILKKTEILTKKDIIGSGGYGVVYKLVLDDQCSYAVKKLVRGGFDNDRGFERELETLSDIKHRNLVTLRGYYSAPQVNLLVYDLMANGSLDDHLHGNLSPDACLQTILLGADLFISKFVHTLLIFNEFHLTRLFVADRSDDEEPLDWPTRLNIALGTVAWT